MNSWQSAGEAHKNKPVVQFLAMVMRLEIITGGASRSKSSSWDKTGPIYLGQGALTLLLEPVTPSWAVQVLRILGVEGIWERCVLPVRLPGSTSSPAHLRGGD